jgi:hypothetical protein
MIVKRFIYGIDFEAEFITPKGVTLNSRLKA